MKIQHNGTLMRIYVSESHRYQHKSAFLAIAEAFASAGIAGVTVFKGMQGYGSHRYVSSANIIDAVVDLPILLEIVDEDDTIRAFIPTLEAILDDGLVTLERVQMLQYRGDA